MPILLLQVDDLPTEHSTHYKHLNFHAIFSDRARLRHSRDRLRAPHAISCWDVYVIGPGSEGHFLDCRQLVAHALMFKSELYEQSTWNGLSALPGFGSLLIGDSASRRLHPRPTSYAVAARDLAKLCANGKAAVNPVL